MAAHLSQFRVYYEDTDAAGIVYHANYLRFAERGRTELMRAAGLDHHQLRQQQDLVLAVRRCRLDFRRPARLDDLLTIATRAVDFAGARIEMCQNILRNDQLLVSVDITVAVLRSDLRPRRLPRHIQAALIAATGSPENQRGA